ncbi:endosomal transmembrane epsin interactor 1 isoform 2-T2 [Clarias gariepinus]|uniref:endosomal transmembrane epsin interactor 1 isoform X2 n=1 Tax=Clarias gariepinus TaxID=13013 RepID=UPI00234D7B85|nr:endosomal transmembrane epsin interactor 1 isoform X2 [Clarias gariepinus]
MSLPVVLPGSCCRLTGASLAPQFADPSRRSRCMATVPWRMRGSESRLVPPLLPARPLLSLGLLQLMLGCSMVALSFGALSLSNSPPVRNSCPFWAGSSVILSGIIGLTTWKRPMLLLVNLFVLLSMVCILLNLAGFILCCQGAQLVSSTIHCQRDGTSDICNCCAESPSKCQEEEVIKIYAGHSCASMRVLLKKVLFALCALNALTTVVCLIAAALRYLQIFSTRRPCMEEPRTIAEEEEQPHIPDPDDFVPPAPPPSYFSTFYSYTPRLARRMFGDSVIPLPHIYGARIKGVEVFCPLDPPPPYEAVAARQAEPSQEQDPEVQVTDLTERVSRCSETDTASNDRCMQTSVLSSSPPSQSITASTGSRKPRRQRHRRSNSDPVLLDLTAKVMSCEAATQTEVGPGTAAGPGPEPEHPVVTLRRGKGHRRPRPSSMVDYQSYRDTKLLVARFLQQQSPCSLTPEVEELINSIKSVLRSDQEHMEEAVRCATLIQQVMSVSESGQAKLSSSRQTQPACTSHTLPLRKRPGLLHLRSCGDLSTFTWAELQTSGQGRPSSRVNSRTGFRTGPRRLAQERPHSLIGVSRETMI